MFNQIKKTVKRLFHNCFKPIIKINSKCTLYHLDIHHGLRLIISKPFIISWSLLTTRPWRSTRVSFLTHTNIKSISEADNEENW